MFRDSFRPLASVTSHTVSFSRTSLSRMSLNNLLTPINNLLTYLQRLLLKDLGGLEEKRRLALAPHNLRVHVR